MSAELMYTAVIILMHFVCHNIQEQGSAYTVRSLICNVPHLQHKICILQAMNIAEAWQQGCRLVCTQQVAHSLCSHRNPFSFGKITGRDPTYRWGLSPGQMIGATYMLEPQSTQSCKVNIVVILVE